MQTPNNRFINCYKKTVKASHPLREIPEGQRGLWSFIVKFFIFSSRLFFSNSFSLPLKGDAQRAEGCYLIILLGKVTGLSCPSFPTAATPKKKLSTTMPFKVYSVTFPTRRALSQVGLVVSLQ